MFWANMFFPLLKMLPSPGTKFVETHGFVPTFLSVHRPRTDGDIREEFENFIVIPEHCSGGRQLRRELK